MEMYQKIAENYDFIFPYKPEQKKFILASETRRQTYCDLGCGTGALAANLTRQFREISAIDISNEMIHLAKQRNAPSTDFFVGSMGKITDYFWKDHFDVVSCFGNTIVHLESIENILRFFKDIKIILRNKGVFLGQIINYDKVFAESLTGLPTIDNEFITFEREYHLNTFETTFDFDTTLLIKKTGEQISGSTLLFPLRKQELEELLIEAGFSSVVFYSDFSKSDYSPEKLPLIFEARL